ncbi:jg14838, partial [Pararge aegeria aegeria]
ELFKRPNNILLRQSEHKSPVNMLDSYGKFHSPLSLTERNRMKEIGYEYIGLALHAMIKNMSPEDTLPISTLLPGKTSSYHHHHE